jgi:hypothetical protein
MAPTTIAGFTQSLADAASIADALRTLRAQLDEIGKGLQVAYFSFDARKQVVVEKYRTAGEGFAPEAFQVSLDHLPTKLRRDLLSGAGTVDFGEQSADFLRFFGMNDPSDGYLVAQGIRANGELCGIVAVREPRQRFSSRVVDRIAAPLGIFALAVGLFGERAARRQAEESLESILERIHNEHAQAVATLKRELEDARRQLTAGGVDARIAELQRSANDALERSKGAAARLQAVEQQVAAAVAQLEKAHLDLSRQSETLRLQGGVLHRVQRLVTESPSGKDPQQILSDVKSAVAGQQ